MRPELTTCLEEIRSALDEIDAYVKYADGFQNYIQDRPSQIIAERLLTVIGEAVKRIQRLDETIIISNASRIGGLRNRLAHDYSNIDHATVYVILTKHLPTLKLEVEALLRQHG